MTEYKYHYDRPFGFTDPTDVAFFQAYLDYLRSLKFDGLAHWSAEDLEFYNTRNYKITNETSRHEKYELLVSTFAKLRGKLGKYRSLLDEGYPDFLHWLSVAETRAHALRKEYWY